MSEYRDTEILLQDLIPEIYEYVANGFDSKSYNLAGSNQCHELTRHLHDALVARDIPVRRELHRLADGRWHYLIARDSADQLATQQDVITDMNPWQFMSDAQPSATFLHMSRFDLQVTLANAGAPAWFVSLRGVATIIRSEER